MIDLEGTAGLGKVAVHVDIAVEKSCEASVTHRGEDSVATRVVDCADSRPSARVRHTVHSICPGALTPDCPRVRTAEHTILVPNAEYSVLGPCGVHSCGS